MPPSNWNASTDWDGTVLLGFDRRDQSANTLNADSITELALILGGLDVAKVNGVIIYSEKPWFCVGADVNEFSNIDKALTSIEQGHACFKLLSKLPFPTVAAINGQCLGGGVELALACDARVSSNDAQIGLPEVRLGIHPGWGGTARLPELVGSHNALPLMILGKPVDAKKALAMGLVDKVCGTSRADLLACARQQLKKTKSQYTLSSAINWLSNSWPSRQLFSVYLNWQTAKKVDPGQYPSPFQIIELWRQYGSLEVRLLNEAASLIKLANTPTAAALIKLFQLQEALKRGDKTAHNVSHIHIVGDTTLAGDLIGLCAREKFVVSIDSDSAGDASSRLENRANAFLSRRLKGAALDQAKSRISRDSSGLSRADLVIEVAPEDLELKRALLQALEPKCKPDALIATTSGIYTLEKLGGTLKRQLVGIHFKEPLDMVPLVEVSQAHDTSRIVSFCKTLGKLPILVQSTPGLLTNRMLVPYLFEALYMLEEGASSCEVDKCAKLFGMPVGPIAYLKDNRTNWAAIAAELGPLLNLRVPAMPDFGSSLEPKRSNITAETTGTASKSPANTQTQVPIDTNRLMAPLLIAAQDAARSRVSASSNLVDGAAVFGFGFAPFLGGPLQYISSRPNFAETLKRLAEDHGDRFLPRQA